MLPIQVALIEFTGKAEMSVFRTLSVGKREHVVPGKGCAAAGAAAIEVVMRPITAAVAQRASW
jgi:hypothetical protein